MNNTSKNRKPEVVAIIPFFNEEQFINSIIIETLKFVDIIFAIDDGSTDSSVDNIPEDDRIILLKMKNNSGKGFALKTGFQKSLDMNFDITITIDADYQHSPEYIPKFLEAIKSFDIVSGNRMHNLSQMPFHRITSNRLSSYLLSKKIKQKIPDSQCGYRAIRNPVLKNILPEEEGFEVETEMLIKAAKQNYKIGFIDIPAKYGEEESKINNWKIIKGFIRMMFS